MTLSLGKASVSYTKAPMTTTNLNHSTSKTSTPTHPPENFIELVDKSTLDTTVRFGGTRSILDEDTVDVEVEVSPLSVDVGKMLDVGEKLKRILKARKGVKGKEGREGKKSGPSTRSKVRNTRSDEVICNIDVFYPSRNWSTPFTRCKSLFHSARSATGST